VADDGGIRQVTAGYLCELAATQRRAQDPSFIDRRNLFDEQLLGSRSAQRLGGFGPFPKEFLLCGLQ
jgi:hypothetical protein